jgi:hypothetical protein
VEVCRKGQLRQRVLSVQSLAEMEKYITHIKPGQDSNEQNFNTQTLSCVILVHICTVHIFSIRLTIYRLLSNLTLRKHFTASMRSFSSLPHAAVLSPDNDNIS